jgi:hypothetical protein
VDGKPIVSWKKPGGTYQIKIISKEEKTMKVSLKVLILVIIVLSLSILAKPQPGSCAGPWEYGVQEIDLTAGPSMTKSLNQSFNETRAVDVKVVAEADLQVQFMTLREFNIVAGTGTVGARIYKSDTGAMIASADQSGILAGSDQSVTIPISAILVSGETYRVGFYINTDPSGQGSGNFFAPVSPYTEQTNFLEIKQTYSIIADAFPTDTNIFLPMITITVGNHPPTAYAGPDIAVTAPGPVSPVATAYDLDWDNLSYQWNCISYPGTPPVLTGADTLTPSFAVSEYGEYIFELTVSDGQNIASDTMTVSFNNIAPVAAAGMGGAVLLFEPVYLDGSASSDPNNDDLSYQWTWFSTPDNSNPEIASIGSSPIAFFIPKKEGTYTAQLVVSDGLLSSEPSIVTYEALVTKDQAIEKVAQVNQKVKELSPAFFEVPEMQRTYSKKLVEASKIIAEKNYMAAEEKIAYDLIRKVDDHLPDARVKDWIKDSPERLAIYEELVKAKEMVGALRYEMP